MAAAAIPLLMKALPWIATGVSSLGGLFGAPKQPESTVDSTNKIEGTSRPIYDEKTGIARDQILQNLLTQVDEVPDFARSYTAAGLDNINATDNARSQILNSLMQRSGFGSSLGSTFARASGQNYRLGQQAGFMNQVPLQMEQVRSNRVNQLSDFFKSLPVGTSTNQTQTGHSKTVGTPANSPWASALTSGATMLGGLLGQGAFGKLPGQKTPASQYPGVG